MQRVIGVICLVAGILLLVWGHNVAQAPVSQVHQVFTGSIPDKAIYLYAGGGALAVIGLFQIFIGK
jgi:hypothetical protein